MLNHNLCKKILSEKIRMEKIDKIAKDFDIMIDEICDKLGSIELKKLKDMSKMNGNGWMRSYEDVFAYGKNRKQKKNDEDIYKLLFISCVKHGLLYGDKYITKIHYIFMSQYRIYIIIWEGQSIDCDYFTKGIRIVSGLDKFKEYIKDVVKELLDRYNVKSQFA